MTPPPDHGEKSYVGSGRLTGRKALITGGDSGMGRAAAIAFAREGADVAINYFPNEEEDAQQVLSLIEEAGRIGARFDASCAVCALRSRLRSTNGPFQTERAISITSSSSRDANG